MGILMRIGEAAQFLGVSQSTLRRWTNGGLFPVWRSSTTGNRYLYVEDLDRWVAKKAAAPRRDQSAESRRVGQQARARFAAHSSYSNSTANRRVIER